MLSATSRTGVGFTGALFSPLQVDAVLVPAVIPPAGRLLRARGDSCVPVNYDS